MEHSTVGGRAEKEGQRRGSRFRCGVGVFLVSIDQITSQFFSSNRRLPFCSPQRIEGRKGLFYQPEGDPFLNRPQTKDGVSKLLPVHMFMQGTHTCSPGESGRGMS